MVQEHAQIDSVQEIAPSIYRLSFVSRTISAQVLPGQFVNIRVEDSFYPLLRRPFSVFSADGDILSIIFNMVGVGTRLLSRKQKGQLVDVLGPLGSGLFPLQDDGYETAIIVAGGLGVAAFPLLTTRLPQSKKVISFVGARTASQIVRHGLREVRVATDDGTEGFQGTVVELLKTYLGEHAVRRPRLFGCGPTAMMRALRQFASEKEIPCYVSLECDMACGVGLCQGCPVESAGGGKKYRLVCKEGPVFDAQTIQF